VDTTVTSLASKAIEFGGKKTHKIRAITPFKVIQGHRGRYQSKDYGKKCETEKKSRNEKCNKTDYNVGCTADNARLVYQRLQLPLPLHIFSAFSDISCNPSGQT